MIYHSFLALSALLIVGSCYSDGDCTRENNVGPCVSERLGDVCYNGGGNCVKGVGGFTTCCRSSSACPAGWTAYGNACYYHQSGTFLIWSAARQICLQKGGDLVSIHSAAENKFLMEFTNVACRASWIGLQKISGVFKWSDGTVVDFNNATRYVAGPPEGYYLFQNCYDHFAGWWDNYSYYPEQGSFTCKRGM